jgi:hypothetical protein
VFLYVRGEGARRARRDYPVLVEEFKARMLEKPVAGLRFLDNDFEYRNVTGEDGGMGLFSHGASYFQIDVSGSGAVVDHVDLLEQDRRFRALLSSLGWNQVFGRCEPEGKAIEAGFQRLFRGQNYYGDFEIRGYSPTDERPKYVSITLFVTQGTVKRSDRSEPCNAGLLTFP